MLKESLITNEYSMKALVIIVIVLVVLGGVWFFMNRDKNANTNTTTNTNTASTQLNTNTTASVNVNTSATVNSNTNTGSNLNANTNATTTSGQAVSVTSSGFQPRSVTISVGGKVTWTNADSSSHYIAPDNHPSHTKYAGTWDDDGSGQISAGQSYSQTFTTAGSYTYHDHLNSGLTGTVIVQ